MVTLLVVDGNSIVNRAFYGIKVLTTKDGRFTNAIYGFLTMLDKIKEVAAPDAVAIAFDLKAPTFRHKAYDGYKANRKGMPNELAQQMQPLKDLLRALGYTIVECEGFEADDILGTLAAKCDSDDCNCVIATGDRDSLQLVSDRVNVRLAATKLGKPEAELYDVDRIKEEYGVSPLQMIDIKALQGDSSDNIPGVAGIGKKGAGDLIQKYGNIDYIYENIDTLDIKPAMRNKLIAGKDSAYMSRMLGTIRRDAPIDTEISHYIVKRCDADEAVRMMASLELFSLIDKWGLRSDVKVQSAERVNEVVLPMLDTEPDSDEILDRLKTDKKAYFIADFYVDEVNAVYVALDDKTAVINSCEEAKKFLIGLLTDESIEKITANSKAVFRFAVVNNIEPKNIAIDVQLAAYLLNPSASSYDTSRLLEEYSVPAMYYEDSIIYSSELASNTAFLKRLSDVLVSKLDENSQLNLLRNIEIPLAKVLANMEILGVKVDKQGIEDYGVMLADKVESLQSEIYASVGYEFNINSPKQLGVALFEKLGLPASKKTKSGYSTSADVLEGLRYAHPAIGMILEYRTLAKLKSTYCDSLAKVTDDRNRIHSIFNQTETRTGRISSLEPNLQNIPVKTEVGRELRRFFVAEDGWTLVDADYSQIELRVLAHIANDTEMIKAFTEGTDIHTVTASQVFKLPVDMVNSMMRSRAKAVNFGIVYGIGAFSLAKDINVTRKEADTYIRNYLSHYNGVDSYMNAVVSKAKEQGYVETMLGRRRYLPELTASNHNLRAFGERVARNMPIQGTAADIIKIAMIKVYDRLKKENMQARLILQVHDELIVEAPMDEAEKAAAILKEEMEAAVLLKVPLTADANIGKTWYDAKG